MNKYQKALKRIRSDYLNNHNPDCDVLEKSVERATPKKLNMMRIKKYDGYNLGICQCGQAIDWSEEE